MNRRQPQCRFTLKDMAKNDELDVLLRDPRLTDKDFADLYEILGIKIGVPNSDLSEFFNREIRHSYGHSAANLFRDCFEPDYSEIVKGTAIKLKIPIKEHHTLEEVENKIIVEIIEIAKEEIIKKKGKSAWEEIEKSVADEVDRLIKDGKIPQQFADEFKDLRGAALMAALLGGRLAGFLLFILANQVFFAVARSLGLGIGVAIAGPIIGRTLAFLLGPPGFVLAGILMAFDLGDTNWKKVVPAIAMVISLRRRLQFGDEGSSAA